MKESTLYGKHTECFFSFNGVIGMKNERMFRLSLVFPAIII